MEDRKEKVHNSAKETLKKTQITKRRPESKKVERPAKKGKGEEIIWIVQKKTD